MTNRRYVVDEVKAALVARGVNLTGPCGAFAITCRVAWALRRDGFGLVGKSAGQNGCNAHGDRYGIDAVMLNDGQTFDVLISAGGEEDAHKQPIPGTGNGPAWQVTGAAPLSSWRAPFDPDAGAAPITPDPITPDPIKPPGDGGTGIPSLDLGMIARALAAVAEEVRLQRTLLTERAGVLQLDEALLRGIATELRTVKTQLDAVKTQQDKGLKNSWLTLKPAP